VNNNCSNYQNKIHFGAISIMKLLPFWVLFDSFSGFATAIILNDDGRHFF
jgi:hypothetical protein